MQQAQPLDPILPHSGPQACSPQPSPSSAPRPVPALRPVWPASTTPGAAVGRFKLAAGNCGSLKLMRLPTGSEHRALLNPSHVWGQPWQSRAPCSGEGSGGLSVTSCLDRFSAHGGKVSPAAFPRLGGWGRKAPNLRLSPAYQASGGGVEQ